MQRVEQCSVDECARPDHGGWPNKELAHHARESEADDLRGEAEHDLVTESPILIEDDALSRDYVRRIRSASHDVGHNGDERVFFDVERSRVEAEHVSEDLEARCREDMLKEFTAREGDQLDDETRYVHRGICARGKMISIDNTRKIRCQLRTSHRKKLIKARNENREDETQEPHPERVDRHIWVVSVRNSSSYFGIR